MPPKRGKKPPSKRVFQPLPESSFWIENDAYDRRVYGYLRSESPSLRELEEAGSTFLPHFGSLLQDIFSLLFKYNVIFHRASDVVASALLNEKFLNGIRHGNQYEFLREQTLLNEARAGLSTLSVMRLPDVYRRGLTLQPGGLTVERLCGQKEPW